MSPEEVVGAKASQPEQRKVKLVELLKESRNEVGYYVHPETGFIGLIVHGGQCIAGIVTRKQLISQYRETIIVDAAVGSVLGPDRAIDVSWERTRGRLNHITYDPAQAKQIKESLEAKMRTYLAKTRA